MKMGSTHLGDDKIELEQAVRRFILPTVWFLLIGYTHNI